MTPIAPLVGPSPAPALARVAARIASDAGAANFAAHLAKGGGAVCGAGPDMPEAGEGAEGEDAALAAGPDADGRESPAGADWPVAPFPGPPQQVPPAGDAGTGSGGHDSAASVAAVADPAGEAAAGPLPPAPLAREASRPLPVDAGGDAGPAVAPPQAARPRIVAHEAIALPKRAEAAAGTGAARISLQVRAGALDLGSSSGAASDRTAAFPRPREVAEAAMEAAPSGMEGQRAAPAAGVSGPASGAPARAVLPARAGVLAEGTGELARAGTAPPLPEAGTQAAVTESASPDTPLGAPVVAGGAATAETSAALPGEGAGPLATGQRRADGAQRRGAREAALPQGLAPAVGAAGRSGQAPAAGATMDAPRAAAAGADPARPGPVPAETLPRTTADPALDAPPPAAAAAADTQPLPVTRPAAEQGEPQSPALRPQDPIPEAASRVEPAGRPAPEPGAAGAARQVAQAVVEYRGGEARLVLDPEELGQVRLTVSHQDGGTLIQIVAERPDTAELMRRHADLLLQDLADSGVAQPRLSFTSGGEAGAGREGRAAPTPPGAPGGEHARAAADPAPAARPLPGARTLDMRV